jgi:hypothetical protein
VDRREAPQNGNSSGSVPIGSIKALSVNHETTGDAFSRIALLYGFALFTHTGLGLTFLGKKRE